MRTAAARPGWPGAAGVPAANPRLWVAQQVLVEAGWVQAEPLPIMASPSYSVRIPNECADCVQNYI